MTIRRRTRSVCLVIFHAALAADIRHSQAFAGYHNNPEATNKKIMRDVLAKGDTYFRTGDLLRRDADGHWYFADRLGDTFRWKSENVSTSDVAAALGEVVKEANVYGVLGELRPLRPPRLPAVASSNG